MGMLTHSRKLMSCVVSKEGCPDLWGAQTLKCGAKLSVSQLSMETEKSAKYPPPPAPHKYNVLVFIPSQKHSPESVATSTCNPSTGVDHKFKALLGLHRGRKKKPMRI